MRYLEDLVVGNRVEGQDTFTVTAEAIKDFAGQWDPMPFHLDEAVAEQSPIGALFASSIHSVAIGVRLSHALPQEPMAVIAGLGWDEVRFPHPVFAGDELRVAAEIVSTRDSVSKPDRGICVTRIELYNQNQVRVGEFKIASLVLKKPLDTT